MPDYRFEYSQMTDGEVLNLAHEAGGLEAEARDALAAELAKRGLRPADVEKHAESTRPAERGARPLGSSAPMDVPPVEAGKWTEITVRRDSVSWPFQCPDCLGPGPLAPVNLRAHAKGALPKHIVIAVPFCRDCRSYRVRWWAARNVALPLLGILALAGGAEARNRAMMVLGIVLLAAMRVLQVLRGLREDRAVRIVAFDAETVTLSFKHFPYAQDFYSLNFGEKAAAASSGG
jgi:hypothetical protein